MIECPSVTKKQIRWHYDLSTLFYRLFWGRHIHHGLWQADESDSAAQIALIEALADAARIARGESIVDIGCGMGGSAIHLARSRGCQVSGVTLSGVQQRWATMAARWHGVAARTEFRRIDAESVSFPPGSVDIVWSVECTEHLFDKPAFFERAASWLRPGGRMAICAWLAGDDAESPDDRRQVYDVCEGFLCPSLGTRGDYEGWMAAAGLQSVAYHDWTDSVAQTWEICLRRIRRSGVHKLAWLVDRDTQLFLARFEAILNAYRSGAMRYGAFVFEKPTAAGQPVASGQPTAFDQPEQHESTPPRRPK
jgi:tocopherol O-methyltransferase